MQGRRYTGAYGRQSRGHADAFSEKRGCGAVKGGIGADTRCEKGRRTNAEAALALGRAVVPPIAKVQRNVRCYYEEQGNVHPYHPVAVV